MTVSILFLAGDTLTLENVESIRIVGRNAFETNIFGNPSVIHREVADITIIEIWTPEYK